MWNTEKPILFAPSIMSKTILKLSHIFCKEFPVLPIDDKKNVNQRHNRGESVNFLLFTSLMSATRWIECDFLPVYCADRGRYK